ncbi:hypothetical protein OBCHQ24_10315 [Oceanobacillus iheyensis]|jgi:hypothetical protein|uniref:hypothetical protein n=1 Tax=Oceanobacillus picturae TaxID=171693 RepID=UPI000D13383D|nr:hypothetical protein OBCHQ24_10315 [Oceanobacillus iheyensis]NAP00577.1 hypothetical protein [Halomonas sp. MG34]
MDEFKSYQDKNQVEQAPNHGENRKNEDYVGVEPDSTRDEEYAAELTADDYNASLMEDANTTSETESDVNYTYGWIAIALSVISFFVWPVIMGAAGIIFGFVSRSKGADTLGNIAIAAGTISIAITLFVLPFI